MDPSQPLSQMLPVMGMPAPAEDPASYAPSPDELQLIKSINDKVTKWRQDRQPHEQQWFVNAAFYRGQQYVEWNDKDQRLNVPKAPSHRIRLSINRIFPKLRARLAKFLKNRPKPIIVPATADQKDRLNARATEHALDYQWRRLRLEQKYTDALLWAKDASKGLWWFHWDPTKMARVKTTDPLTGQSAMQEAALGDLDVEVGSPFELLVADPGTARLGDQSAIIRLKLRKVADLKLRYPDKAAYIEAGSTTEEVFRYEKQIATLNATGFGGSSMLESRIKSGDGATPELTLVKEYFERPNGEFAKGRYHVVAGDVLLATYDELPYGFSDLDNPYPCVEFNDVPMAGQFWGPTVCEQLIGLQREYNLLRSKVAEQIRMMAFPKLIAAKQHQIPPGAWTTAAGEFVEYIALPGVPPPQPFVPPNIAQDVWRTLELIQKEFEDITHIFPSSEGRVGTATSGFQTNLLQEATDSVHAPDVRMHEMAIEEAALKIRRLMKTGYSIPRMMTILGANAQPEVFEFSSEQIDEHADLIIQAGSGLPDLKYARVQSIMELFTQGVLGDPADPEVKRKTLGMLEMGGLEEAFDPAKRDEELARIENVDLTEGRPLPVPEFFQNHQIHYQIHCDELKSPESREWPEPVRLQMIAHIIKHTEFINPLSAAQLAQEYGLLGSGLLKPQTEMMLLAPPPMIPIGPEAPPPSPHAAASPHPGGTAKPLGAKPAPTSQPAAPKSSQGSF